MIVKINPADVVAIPSDYNNTKGRTCRYEVVSEYKEDWRSKINRGESGFDSELYSSDGGDYDCEEDDDFCDSVCHKPSSIWEKFIRNSSDSDVYGVKPSGHKYHNVRDDSGKFSKKNW